MDIRVRGQYLNALLERYLKAGKRDKGLLLDEYCRNTGQGFWAHSAAALSAH